MQDPYYTSTKVHSRLTRKYLGYFTDIHVYTSWLWKRMHDKIKHKHITAITLSMELFQNFS